MKVRGKSWGKWFKPRLYSFQQGRISERARVVEWLRTSHVGAALPGIADAIARGEHLKG